ncbi:hypothetical protein OQA88_318 [Cercophora sp. LCS_1]
MKRQAEDEGLAALASKKQATDWPEGEDLSAETGSVLSAAGSESTSAARPTQTDAATSITASTHVSRKYPSDLKTIPCTVPGCSKTFNRPARLTAHLRSHTNDRPFCCPYDDCDKDYREEKHLTQHIKGSHTHEKKYMCEEPDCGKSFVTSTRLRRHALVHEGAERFRCRGYEPCNKSFRKHQTLQRHVRTDHLGAHAFECGNDGCEAGFDSAGALRRHVEKEHGELKFWCDECSTDEPGRVGFTTMQLLQAHMRKEHVNCAFCDTKCTSQGELERHIDLYHSGTSLQERKTIVCTYEGCGKSFTRKSNLNTHIRTAHEGVRWVCGEVDTYEVEDLENWNWQEEGCKKEFMSKVKLEEHVRFVHLGKHRPPRMYTIPSREDRARELDYELGVAPLNNMPCPEQGCQARFVRSADLGRHILQNHSRVIAEGLDAIDPSLKQDDGPWFEASAPGFADQAQPDNDFWQLAREPQSLFEADWDEMRKLIDIDGFAQTTN